MASISGTSGNDSLVGTAGNDTLNGFGGNDTLVASGGIDFYDGGSGFDTLDVKNASTGVSVNFTDGTMSGGLSGTFVNMERVFGSNAGDRLIGAAGGQNLSARGGNDTLEGGAGVDTLWGGTGADSFVFRETGTANADRLGDFASGADKIVLDGSVMSALGASGNFAAGDARFAANSSGSAQDSSDRIIFNTATQQIFYERVLDDVRFGDRARRKRGRERCEALAPVVRLEQSFCGGFGVHHAFPGCTCPHSGHLRSLL